MSEPTSERHEFDRYETSYAERVDRVVSFSGRDLDFFTRAKVRVLRRIVDGRLGDAGNASILDVGCGPGEADGLLSQVFRSVAGVDVSEAMLRAAAARNPQVTYRASDGRRLPFDDNAFDVTFASCVLHHVPPADWLRFVTEMARVTRPRGLVALIEHNPLNPLTRLVVSRCEFDDDAHLLRARRASELLRAVGLERCTNEHFLVSPWVSRVALAVERLSAGVPLGAQYVATGIAPPGP